MNIFDGSITHQPTPKTILRQKLTVSQSPFQSLEKIFEHTIDTQGYYLISFSVYWNNNIPQEIQLKAIGQTYPVVTRNAGSILATSLVLYSPGSGTDIEFYARWDGDSSNDAYILIEKM